MSKYQVRLGENVTDKIVNCGAGVYWYIDKLQSEIERLNRELEEKEAILGGIQQLEAEIERLNKDIKELLKENENKEKVIKAQDNIINKAIEYIENKVGTEIHDMMYVIDVSDILDILQGSDNE